MLMTRKKSKCFARRKNPFYVLALKGNQGTLFEDTVLYFADNELLAGCSYHKTIEKARGCVEIREYWQTDDISWLIQRKDWAGLKSVVMTKNTITKKGKAITQTRYFISSLPLNVKEVARAIRKHWLKHCKPIKHGKSPTMKATAFLTVETVIPKPTTTQHSCG